MDRTERFYKIEKLLRQHKTVSFCAMQAALEVSRATLKRDLDLSTLTQSSWKLNPCRQKSYTLR